MPPNAQKPASLRKAEAELDAREKECPDAVCSRPRGRPKVKPDSIQRQEIVAAARELFIAQGYARTTMDDIAAKCRVSKRTFYRLFPSKLEVFAEIVRENRNNMLALPGDYSSLTPCTALEKIFCVDLDEEHEQERMAILQLIMVESRQVPELMEVAKRVGGDTSRADLADWLRTRARNGELKIDDPEGYAQILMDMIFGIFASKTADDMGIQFGPDRVSHVRRCIRIFLRGVEQNCD